MTFHRLALLAGLALVLAILMPGPAHAMFEYEVTGVASDDQLNMRAHVGEGGAVSDATIVGTIPWNGRGLRATGLAVTIGASVWREVIYGGVRGWVNAHYLKQVRVLYPDGLPLRLSCGGNEPFWSLALSDGAASFDRMGNKTRYSVVSARSATNHRRRWWLRLANGGRRASAVVSLGAACSDGMSDFDYPLEILWLGEDGGDDGQGTPMHGCCSLR